MDKITALILLLVINFNLYAEEVVIPSSLLKQVEAGNAESAFFIASTFAYGNLGVEKNIEKAKEWFLKSAEMGYVHGMFEIGKLLYADKSYAEAKPWFEKASTQGHGESFYRLSMYSIYDLTEDPFDCHKAYELMAQAELRGVKSAFNDHAWMLSTLPDKNCRNGQKAWKIFAELMELYGPMEPIPWAYLDTKAAVFAEIAEFNEAINVQTWIVEDFCDVDLLLEGTEFDKAIGQLAEKYQQNDDGLCLGAVHRLQAYLSRQPWRESPQ
jgi:TPR repeat protein